jgi:proteic killer suppression protein
MIQGFACKETAKVFAGERSRKLAGDMQETARRKLKMMDAAACLEDLRMPPGNRLEALRGDRAGQYSIRINQQWRVCFVWTRKGPTDVEIADYHP